ncbi:MULTISPECIES: cyclic peptide export ABC transporter [unclassified Campylobacter]|uniref:cyclic peptide export ABC transporter n=1 Tax=unclassified Campylobacter TaxID=2593542 RepID=UPI001B410264|nr:MULTISPECIES: cyclic peptide export ABC transporter [unclassified Campylobacter]MBP3207172.1 cyclic peptide export ABC transporter [Campylobacter sp.]MDA3056126.1 cyclic peptide export ABC transporter [Campylobacter sp. CN_NA1]MDA3065271.1 cyclic peptide export ABC transporter [Campylobacter sp. CN_NE4]MDA3068096.1 cyclic peptide export ABC transporter [Campylobacter sp. CN_NE3]MDA3082724.1 cyclic peptide export ABC transporter [Campylobacter sp. CN_EL2]
MKEILNKFTPALIKQIIFMIVLNAIYSGSSIAILSFINKYLLKLETKNLQIMFFFFALLLLFLGLSILSRAVLCKIETNFVFNLRSKIIKQIIDTKYQKIEQAGQANLLASLSSDISRLTDGFMRISELVQGVMMVIFVGIYIAYISFDMFLFLFFWIGALMIIWHFFMKKVIANFDAYRQGEDALYKNYKASIEGHKELSINSVKAKNLYENKFLPNATNLRQTSLRAQIYQAFASNFMSIMLLGAVGVVLYYGLGGSKEDLANAVTVALTVLFLRGPLMTVAFSFPSLLRAKIAFNKIQDLNLDEFKPEFWSESLPEWKSLKLKNINFRYKNSEFGLKNINLEINSGEIVFLVGDNGSGKSTLFMILAGLYEATSGEIWVDDTKITEQNLQSYRNNISAIFSDFYLFDDVLGDEEIAKAWLEKMALTGKVNIEKGEKSENEASKFAKFSTTNLSSGQRKRLAMVSTLLENNKFLMLDEWAADQDPVFRKQFYEEILGTLKAKGYTIFAISHDDRYFEYADKIYKMKNGEISRLK